MNIKLFRITTVPISLKTLLKGQHSFMSNAGFDLVGISSSGTELLDVQQKERIRVIELEMTRTINPFSDLRSLWLFYRLCKKEKPTIVHSHTPKAGIVGMLGAWLARVPIRLHTVAGLPLMEAKGVKRRILDIVEQVTYGCASRVYPNSKGLYDFIVESGYTNREKLHVIGEGSSNGIDIDFFDPEKISILQRIQLRQELNIVPEDFVFVFVGRLVGDKGINELVKAFRGLDITEMGEKGVGIKLLLVGPLEAELDPLSPETLLEIKVNPNIISLGFQEDVRPYLAISDALVFPSYREGFPNVVMQAGAMGLPCIVSDINGCNEIIVDGKNGTIIPVKDIEALKQAMRKLIDDSAYYNRMVENARPMIERRYEQKVIWEALLTEYQRLLELKNLQK